MIREDINRFLERDPLQALPVRGFFATRPVQHVMHRGNSLILCGQSDHLWAYLFSATEPGAPPPRSPTGVSASPKAPGPGESPPAGDHEMKELLRECREITPFFANVQPWMAHILASLGDVEWTMDTRRLYYPLSSSSRQITPGEEPLPPIDPDRARFIQDNSDYREYTSSEYIRERLLGDISSGITLQGTLVAWGLTHDDRSLGFLHVLPAWRRQGLAERVLGDLVRKRQARGEIPFLNVEPRNQPSMRLVERTGFLPDRPVSWIKMKFHGSP